VTPLGVTPREALEALAASAPAASPPPGRQPARRQAGEGRVIEFDLRAWLKEYAGEFDLGEEKQLDGGGWVQEIMPCPWGDHERDRAAFVGQRASGAIIAGCRHDRCAGKGWRDLRELLEPVAERPQPKPATNGKANGHNEPHPNAPEEPEPIQLVTAEEILRRPGRQKVIVYPTGFPGLDQRLGGGWRRGLIAVVAPTGVGKTGFVVTCGFRMALAGVPVLLVGGELDMDENAMRFVAPEIQTSVADMECWEPDSSDWARAADAVHDLPIYPIYIDGPVEREAFAIVDRYIEAIHARHQQYPFVIVDYLQLFAGEEGDGRRLSVTRVASLLRRLSLRINMPVMAVGSVSRAYYGKHKDDMSGVEDPRAWLAAAKESGDIEYAVSVFLYLEVGESFDVYGEADARLIIAKARRGTPGFVGAKFHGPTGAFRSADEAMESFGPAARDAAVARKEAELHAAILRAVEDTFPAPTKDALKNGLVKGHRGNLVGKAVDALVQQRDLTVRRERREDESGGRMQVKKVLYLTSRAPAKTSLDAGNDDK